MRSALASFGLQRFITHILLALFSVGGCYVAHLYAPFADFPYLFTLGFGYVSLVLIGVTLLLGPLNLLRRRRNGVNIYLRRDAGIWAGITGCLHVIFALQLYHGGQILLYFLVARPDGSYRILSSLAGLSNYLGLFATFVLILLLVTSNNLFLRRLKGRRWKALQRYNYGLAVLTILHTYGYQVSSQREMYFRIGALALTLVVLAGQGLGIFVYNARRTHR